MSMSALVSKTLNRVCLENTELVIENKELKAVAALDQPIEWHLRGIGREGGLCIITGEDVSLGYNLSGLVKTREDGELIVDLFQGLAKLDYRSHEPNRVQVKVIVDTQENEYILEELTAVVKINGDFIRPSQIANFMSRHCLPRPKKA